MFTVTVSRVIFGGQTDQPRTPEQEWYYKRVSFWMKRLKQYSYWGQIART